MRGRRSWLAALVLGLVVPLAACQVESPVPPPEPTPPAGDPVALDFLAYGPEEEVAAYQSMVDRFNNDHPTVEVSLTTARNADAAFRAISGRGERPDVFLASRRDLAEIAERGLNQPIDELLDSRGVDFGDFYKRDAQLAFALDGRLQCMPHGASPMVIYYNTDLIDFETMAERELPVPSNHASWSFDQFAAAAQFASRRGIKGAHIEPSLLGITPFVLSGGGEMYDDNRDPTTLRLSEEGSRAALERTLQLLRRNRISPSPAQLRRSSALERFKAGRLGMIAGFRTLVPELRDTPSLSFDVMPMPRLETGTTVGDVSGICLSSDPESVSAAADFVVHAISAESVAEVAEAGYLVPAHNEVAESETFLQPDRLPQHAEVFNRSVRDVVVPPLLDSLVELEEAIHPELYRLFYARVIDLEAITERIDEVSRTVIAPELVTEDPEEEPEGSPDGD